jgi:hypothetical protein
VDERHAYRGQPAHYVVVTDHTKPILAARTAVQHDF